MRFIILLVLAVNLVLGVNLAHALNSVDEALLINQNILQNSGYESGKGKWNSTGGSFAINTSGVNLARGKGSAEWDAASSGHDLESAQVNIPNGLVNTNCLARAMYKTTDATGLLAFQVLDGVSNILVDQVLTPTNGLFSSVELGFVCPASGTLGVRFTATGDADIVYVDDIFLGNNYRVGAVSQAEIYGTVRWDTPGCIWTRDNAVFGDFPANALCNPPTTITGAISAPATAIPAWKANDLPPGRYEITVYWGMRNASSTGIQQVSLQQVAPFVAELDNQLWRIGATASFEQGRQSMSAVIDVAVTDNYEFHLYGKNSVPTETVGIYGDADIDMFVVMKKYPLDTQLVYNVDEVGWHVDATITGADPSLGTVAVPTSTEIVDAGLSIAANQNSAPVEIPCSGTNPSTGATCSVGNESLGVVFDLLTAGDVLACVNFSHVVNLSGVIQTMFRIAETPNNAQTILQIGDALQDNVNNVDSPEQWAFPFRLCDILTFDSIGQKTLRLMYTQSVTPTVNNSQINADNSGGRTVRWEVYPLRSFISAPLLVNTVVSKNLAVERILRASIGFDGGGVPSVARQSGGIDSITDTGPGDITLNFAADLFTGAPSCTATGADNPADANIPVFKITAVTAASAKVGIYAHGSSTVSDRDLHIICIGQK